MGCYADRPSGAPIPGAGSASPAPDGYSVAGVVRDIALQPIGAATVEVIAPGFTGRFATSDEGGRYEVGNLAGGVQLRASKAGFFAETRGLRPGGRTQVDFILQPVERISPPEVIRSALTGDDPECAGRSERPTGLRGRHCRRFLLEPTTDGMLRVLLAWADRGALLLTTVAPDGHETVAPATQSPAAMTLRVKKGQPYELRVHGELVPQVAVRLFELQTSVE